MERAVKFGLVVDQGNVDQQSVRKVTAALSNLPTQVAQKAIKLGMIPPSQDDEKKKARAERFGVQTIGNGASEDDKKKQRLERFGNNPINHYNLDSGRVIINSLANKRLKDN